MAWDRSHCFSRCGGAGGRREWSSCASAKRGPDLGTCVKLRMKDFFWVEFLDFVQV